MIELIREASERGATEFELHPHDLYRLCSELQKATVDHTRIQQFEKIKSMMLSRLYNKALESMPFKPFGVKLILIVE